jgi:hypothetical protein
MTASADDAWFAAHSAELIALVDRVSAVHEMATGSRKRKQMQPQVPLKRVISGGQTGADRAALEAAVQCGIDTGGTLPWGYLKTPTADLRLRDVYGLTECRWPAQSAALALIARSMKNVDDADVTIAFRTSDSPGTNKTIAYCRTGSWPKNDKELAFGLSDQQQLPSKMRPNRVHRPCLIIENAEDISASSHRIAAFLRKYSVDVLNVCGHRNDETAQRSGYTKEVRACLAAAFELYKKGDAFEEN